MPEEPSVGIPAWPGWGGFLLELVEQIQRALEEDIGSGDATTSSIVPPDATMRGRIIAKQDGGVAGLDVARRVFALLDERVTFTPYVEEGARVEPRQVLAEVSGPARGPLTRRTAPVTLSGRRAG